jgi:DNA-nicking Smr family endonuclease
MSRRRHLSDEEHALWVGIARSLTPLRKVKATPKANVVPGEEARAPSRPAAPHPPPPPAKSLPLAPFERRLKQRVARGRDAIDARIDLHGMTQRQAHAALLSFLRRAQADDAKVALVVTGKGDSKGAHDPSERGVLRRQVPMWLAQPEFRHFVVGFDEAHPSHGGQGALYVRLRRAR